MPKISITIEAETYVELQRQLQEILQNSAPVISGKNILEEIENRKASIKCRKKKAWTKFEENFLIDNYKSKNVEWLSQKLLREKTAIHQKLHKMYKEIGIPKKNNHKPGKINI